MPKIIGLVGHAGSGKTTLAKKYVEARTAVRVGFADEIKRILIDMGLFTPRELYTTKTESSRQAMQEFGEWVRKYDYSYWTNICKDKITEFMKVFADVIIDDVRRLDEASMIRNMGGVLIRIKRESMDTITDYSHISETEMNEIICDYSIDNDGSIEQAFNKLMQIVGRHNGY